VEIIRMVNDEFTQIHRAMFNRISLGLVLIGFLTAIVSLATLGVASVLFLYGVTVVVIAASAYVIGWLWRLRVGTYVLIVGLVGLAVLALAQPGAIGFLSLFALFPLVIITGTLLSPVATLVTTAILIAALFGAAAFSGQMSMVTLAVLFSASGIMLLVALLMAGNRYNLRLLDQRLYQNRTMLKERALELMQSLNRIELLEADGKKLESRLKQAQQESRKRQVVSVENNELFMLVQGSVKRMNEAVEELEAIIERVADVPTLNGSQEVIDSAWQRLHGLRALLDHVDEMSHTQLESFDLETEPVDLDQLIFEVTGTATALARGKPVEVKSHVAEDIPLVKGDAARLRQVLLHLLSNAIKFTDRGLIEIRGELDDQNAVILVSDTGIGMSSEEAARAFDMFGRGESAEAEARRGAGLGLALCKRLIELHSGRIWVTSVKNIGTTVYLSLPVKPSTRMVPLTGGVGKTTMRLSTVSLGHSEKETVVLPRRADEPPPRQRTPASAGDGSTLLMPRPVTATAPVGHTAVSPIETTVVRPPRPTRSGKMIQPIHRYQPKYIQRFGFILLGLLFIVIGIVISLAVFNYVTRGQVIEATAAAEVYGTVPPATTSSMTADAPDDDDRGAAAAVADTPTPVPSPTLGQAATEAAIAPAAPTATQPATDTPQPTATPPPTATNTPQPSPSPLPPTATPSPSPTEPPDDTPTAIPSPTATSSPQPSATTAATVAPAAVPVRAPRIVAGGGEETQFEVPVAPNSRVSWSAAGQAAYTGQAGSGRDIYVASPAGGESVNLTGGRTDDLQPAWSPDGRQIAFSSGRNGSFDIFVMDADGGNVRQVTGGAGFDEWPAWSPDGRQLAFVSDRDGNSEIYTVNVDGGNVQRRTNHPAEDWPVSWSPDGRWLVFSSYRDGNWNLYLLPLAGGEAIQLTDAPGDEREPVWLSDGSIAFAWNGGDNWDVYTLRPNNAPLGVESWTQVTDSAADERFPAQR
jgi:signal transduction histidine kinase